MSGESLIRKIRAEHIDDRKVPMIVEARRAMLDSFRKTSPKGEEVMFLGKRYVVFPGVFRPYYDTQLLIENYHVNPGESVFDLCTGCGVIAIDAAKKGAGRVFGIDISQDAVKAATINAYLHGVSDRVCFKQEDIQDRESWLNIGISFHGYDVITANPPFIEGVPQDITEKTIYYPKGFSIFGMIINYLSRDGRAYILQSNFGDAEEILRTTTKINYGVELIAENSPAKGDMRKYYLFEVRK